MIGKNNKVDINKDGFMKGENVVFTEFRDAELEKLIEKEGGKMQSSVNKKTTLLLYINKGTSKYNKAMELNIKTMTKEEFLKKFKTT